MTLLPLNQQPEIDKQCYHRRQEDHARFSFTIPLLESEDDGTASNAFSEQISHLPQELINQFQKDGFAVFRDVISSDAVAALNDGLEDVLRGDFDRGRKPDKVPKRIKSNKPQPSHENLILESSMSSTNDSDNRTTNNKYGLL